MFGLKTWIFSGSFLLLVLATSAQQPKLVLPVGHTSGITHCVFSPDGKKILTASNDGTAKLWDATTGKLLLNLNENFTHATSVRFSPDGAAFVVSSFSSLYLFNSTNGKLIRQFSGHGGHVYLANFSSDGKKIVSGADDRTAKIWDVLTGKLLLSIDNAHLRYVSQALFSPDGTLLFTASSSDSIARIWDAETGELKNELVGHSDGIIQAEFNSKGTLLSTVSSDYTARYWDPYIGLLVATINPGRNPHAAVNSSRFSHDDQFAITASADFNAVIWDVETFTAQKVLSGHTSYVNDAVFSPDDKMIVTSSLDGTARIWDTNNGALRNNLKEHRNIIPALGTGSVNFSVFSPDGKFLATIMMDNVRLWDTRSGDFFADLGVTNRISYVGVSPDKSTLFISSGQVAVSKLFDLRTGKILKELKGMKPVTGFAFSPDSRKLFVCANDNSVWAWKSTGESLYKFKAGPVDKVKVSPDNRKLILYDNHLEIHDPGDGNLLMKMDSPDVEEIAFGRPSLLFTGHNDSAARVWNMENGKLNYVLRGHQTKWVTQVVSNSTGRKIVTTGPENGVRVWDAENGKLLANLPHQDRVRVAVIDTSDNLVITASNRTIRTWNANTGSLLKEMNSIGEISSLVLIENGKHILAFHSTNKISTWDYRSGTEVNSFLIPSNSFFGDVNQEKNLAILERNGQLIFYNFKTGKEVYSVLPLNGEEYITFTPEGYYQASSNAARQIHYVTPDLKIIAFDQLDVKYNRPDKILEAVKSSDSILIKSYRKAWEKRIKKLGIDTTQFNNSYVVPELEILNGNQISYNQMKERMELRIQAKDPLSLLDKMNVWVNEVPVFGQKGIPLKKSRQIDTTITVILSAGKNRIEASVTNLNGLESYKMPLNFYLGSDPSPVQKVYFIGLGVDRFADSHHNLLYSCKDIRDIAEKLKAKYGENVIIDTLFNSHVTTEMIRALKAKLRATTVNDKVVIAYSGHGLLSKTYDYFLSTSKMDFDSPENNGLPYEELENLLDSIPARKKLMLIDACHSGEVDKDDLVQVESANTNGVKGLKLPVYKKEGQLGLQSSFELMQSLFVNVSKGTGATVISAAAGTQFAMERGDLKNGVFTYAILEAVDKYPKLKVSELRRLVSERVEQLTGGAQRPTSRSEPVSSDWEL